MATISRWASASLALGALCCAVACDQPRKLAIDDETEGEPAAAAPATGGGGASGGSAAGSTPVPSVCDAVDAAGFGEGKTVLEQPASRALFSPSGLRLALLVPGPDEPQANIGQLQLISLPQDRVQLLDSGHVCGVAWLDEDHLVAQRARADDPLSCLSDGPTELVLHDLARGRAEVLADNVCLVEALPDGLLAVRDCDEYHLELRFADGTSDYEVGFAGTLATWSADRGWVERSRPVLSRGLVIDASGHHAAFLQPAWGACVPLWVQDLQTGRRAKVSDHVSRSNDYRVTRSGIVVSASCDPATGRSGGTVSAYDLLERRAWTVAEDARLLAISSRPTPDVFIARPFADQVGELWRLDLSGGEQRLSGELWPGKTMEPQITPEGRVLFIGGSGEVATADAETWLASVPLAGGPALPLVADLGPFARVAAPGSHQRVFYCRRLAHSSTGRYTEWQLGLVDARGGGTVDLQRTEGGSSCFGFSVVFGADGGALVATDSAALYLPAGSAAPVALGRARPLAVGSCALAYTTEGATVVRLRPRASDAE